jgi:hypothetical protein
MPSKPKPAAVKSAVSAFKSKPAARGPPAKPKPSSAAKAGRPVSLLLLMLRHFCSITNLSLILFSRF